MNLSSDSCLKRIRLYVNNTGYQEVSDKRIRDACIENNFNPRNAANQLIKEEQLKVYLEELCFRLGYQPNKKFISTSCIKYKFAQKQVENYTLKLFKAKKKVISECRKQEIKIPNDNKLNHLILFYFGNWKIVLQNIRQDL